MPDATLIGVLDIALRAGAVTSLLLLALLMLRDGQRTS